MNIAISIALQLLSYVLTLISQIKADAGLSDDQVNAQAQAICGDNDALYQQMKAALTIPPAS